MELCNQEVSWKSFTVKSWKLRTECHKVRTVYNTTLLLTQLSLLFSFSIFIWCKLKISLNNGSRLFLWLEVTMVILQLTKETLKSGRLGWLET